MSQRFSTSGTGPIQIPAVPAGSAEVVGSGEMPSNYPPGAVPPGAGPGWQFGAQAPPALTSGMGAPGMGPPALMPPGMMDTGDFGEGEFDIKEYLHKLQQHWRLVTLVCLLCLGIGIVQFFITPKAFQARALLQLERRSLSPLTGNASPWLDNWWNMEYYPTQERLLQSRGLAERVVRQLRLDDAGAVALHDTETTDADLNDDPLATDALAADRAQMARVANQIRGGLGVRRIEGTQLVELTYRANDPERAARLANAFAEAFIDMGIETRFQTAGRASSFLGEQVETLKGEIAEREQLLQALSRRTDIALDPASNVTLERLRALNQDYIEAKKQRIEKQALYEERVASPAENVADQYSGGEVSAQRSLVLQLEQDYNARLNTFKEEWPEMVELKGRIEKARQSLNSTILDNAQKARETARAEYQAALRQERALEQEIETLKARSLDQKSTELEYINLEDEVNTRRQLLNELLRRQSETDVTVRLQNTRDSNVRIIDTALVPGGPFRPSLRKNLTLGLAAGLLLGLGLAVLIEYLDRTVKNPDELERLLHVPTLTVVPDVNSEDGGYGYNYGYSYGYGQPSTSKSPERRKGRRTADKEDELPAQIELLPHSSPRLAVAEAYRSLRTALLLSTADELRAIAITSAEAGEGKTATVSNLAVVMAQLGRNVLIIDADLRKPRQHEVFGISNRKGLVNYLTGTAEARDALFSTKVPNLYLCPSGPIPPNPSELLASERMRQFVAHVRKQYDFVLIDTPPTLAVTDATLIGYLVDGMVLCCRAGRLQRDAARTLHQRLALSGVRLLGAVLNRHRPTGSSYRARKYLYYGYGPDGRQEADEKRTRDQSRGSARSSAA